MAKKIKAITKGTLLLVPIIFLVIFFTISPNVASQTVPEQVIDEIDLECIDPDCIEEIPLPVEIIDILDEITEPEPITSDDDTITQIIDEITPSPLTFGISRIYTHADGLIEQSDVTTQELTLQSFITEKGSFQNLITTDMAIQIDIMTDKQVLDGRLTIAYLIDGESNSVLQRTQEFNGVPQDGKFVINTQGFIVGDLLKSITKPRASIITVEIVMIEAFVLLEGEERFAITEQTPIYTIMMQRDLDKIISTDEKGNPVKIFPTDDTLKICSAWSNVRYGEAKCSSSTKGRCNRYTTSPVSWVDRPLLGAIVVKDSAGNILASTNPISPVMGFAGLDGIRSDSTQRHTIRVSLAICPLDIQIQSAGTYTVQITSPQNDEFTFKTPRSQKNYVWTCTGGDTGLRLPAGFSTPITCNYPK